MYSNKEKIYQYLTTIPKGKVVTYKQIATHLGNEKLARYVGNVLHVNKNPIKYPCYKVVNAKGELASNFAYGGLDGQRERLKKDNIVVIGNKVDLTKYQWISNK